MSGWPPEDVLELLFRAAVAAEGEAGGVAVVLARIASEDDPLAARLARHGRAILAGGGTPLFALDDTLVALLFAGEVAGVRQPGRGISRRIRRLAEAWEDYPDRLRRTVPAAGTGNPRRNLQLMITRRCQLRCEYCPVVKGERDMPREVIGQAVDLLLTAPGGRVRLDLTGGESLLRPDAVRFAAARLRKGAVARGLEADLYMVTNGFELDRARARELADLGFEVELSLDGPRDLHNRWKVALDPDEDPYRRTADALGHVVAAGGRHRVVMVVTPETVDRLPASFDHVVGLGAAAVDVNYAVGRRWAGEPLRAYLAGLREVVERHAAALESGELRLGNLSSRNEPSILNGEWMVGTDGAVHLMTEWALERWRPSGTPDGAVGRVGKIERWDDLTLGRFHAYLILLRTYGWRDPELRATLLDGVITGREVARALAGAGAP